MNYIHIGFQRIALGQTEFCPRLNDLNRLASPSSLPYAIQLRIDTADVFTFTSGLKAELWGEGRGSNDVLLHPTSSHHLDVWLVCRDKPWGQSQSRKQAK